jgi:hypothetical protein
MKSTTTCLIGKSGEDNNSAWNEIKTTTMMENILKRD